jgi:Ser/Thr protein kinase RdoA (MazF antagonist)
MTDTMSTTALAEQASEVYGLAPPVSCARLSSGLNEIYLLRAADRQYALKVYRRGWRSREQIDAELAAVLHLGRKGVAVAEPIACRDGGYVWTLADPHGARQAVLFAHTEGAERASPSASDCRLFGRTLADIHNATDDFHLAPLRYGPRPLLGEPLEQIGLRLAHRGDVAFLRRLGERVGRRIRSLGDALDWGFCHGDFRPSNLHVSANGERAVAFDFEFAGLGYRAYDLADMQFNLHPTALRCVWEVHTGGAGEELWDALLDGYSELRPGREVDAATVPAFVAARGIHLIGFLLAVASRPGFDDYWPRSGSDALPGGDLLDRTVRFLREWDGECLRDLA